MAKLSKSGFKNLDKPVKKPTEMLNTIERYKRSAVNNNTKNKNVQPECSSSVVTEKQQTFKQPKHVVEKVHSKVDNQKSQNRVRPTKPDGPTNKNDRKAQQALDNLYKYARDFKIIFKVFMVEHVDKNKNKLFIKNIYAKLRFFTDKNGQKTYYLDANLPVSDEGIFTTKKIVFETCTTPVDPIISFSIMPDSNVVFRTKRLIFTTELMISVKRLSPMSSSDKGFLTGK